MNICILKEEIDRLVKQYYISLKKESATYGELEIKIKKASKELMFTSSSNNTFVEYVKNKLLQMALEEKNALFISK